MNNEERPENDNSDEEIAVYLSRPRDPDGHTQRVQELLDRLAELERQTHPLGGEQNATRKDMNAFQALEIAGELVRVVAGWALDHQYGLALHGLEFLPLYPPQVRKLPEYIKDRRLVDDHRHELSGASVTRGVDIEPRIARKLLYNLLYANPGGFPDSLQHLALEALKALDFGEVPALFEPCGKYVKAEYRELQLQLWALALVEYRATTRGSKTKARKEVAAAYNVAPSTLTTWEYRLRKKLGYLRVSSTIARARNIATHVEAARLNAYKIPGANDEGHIEWGESLYGSDALKEAAEKYAAVIRER
jgi:hypothetical protein